MIKRVISMALALMLMLCCFAGVTVSAENAAYTAKLGYATSDWSVSEWGDNVNTTVTGAGTYTLSWDAAAADALVFVIDIEGAAADFAAANLQLTALTVTADGVELPVDLSKVVTGDLEEKGNFRIEIYNEYGSTKENAPIDPKAVTFATNLTITFTIADPNAVEYAAKLGYATSDWAVSEWGDNVNTTVTGAGTYTLSWDAAAADALVFVIDIEGAAADFAAKNLGLVALSVIADGVELPVDLSNVVTGDLEEKGNYRIEIYNEYGSTKENAPIDPKAVTFATNLTITFTLADTTTTTAAYDAKLGYSNSDWSASEWGDNANTVVNGAGEYSITWNGAANDALVFVIDIVGAAEEFAAKNLNLTALSVLVDGTEVPVDFTKIVTGDLEEKGNFRIEIYNEYGSTKENAPIDPKAVTFATSLTINFTIGAVEAPVEPEGPAFDLFIAYGGDKGETGWGYEYYGAETEKSAGITATNAQIRVGETATISLVFDEAPTASWFFSPCLVADDVTWIGDIDFEVICKINGEEVAVDMAADSQGRTWWTEGTGDYTAAQCIRLAGSYNEWGTKYITLPETITSIEYTITLKSITEAPPAGAGIESTEEYRLLLGFQGGTTAEGWDLAYFGNPVEGITAVEAVVKSGDTATISLTFAQPVGEAWYFMPVLVGPGAGENISLIDFDMILKIDGVEVPINWEADAEGKTWWQEGTDSFIAEDCIRMGGGYNEWATKYVDKPTGFTTIEYIITFNSIQLAPEEEEPTIVEIDPMGTYNAYLMLQTPNWTFRNAHDDAYYGMAGSSWEALGLSWGQYLVHQDHPGQTWGVVTDAVIAGNGTYSVSITDFGTIFADDFAAAGQEYFNIIAISTDLPAGANVVITNVELVIDGKVRHTYPEAYINEESTGTLQILIQNIWNSDVKELNYYPAPSESLEIRFTISGFGYDKEGTSEPDVTEPTTPAETKPAETKPAETQPAGTDAPAPIEPAGNNTVIIVVVVALVIVAVVVVVVISKKKKA